MTDWLDPEQVREWLKSQGPGRYDEPAPRDEALWQFVRALDRECVAADAIATTEARTQYKIRLVHRAGEVAREIVKAMDDA